MASDIFKNNFSVFSDSTKASELDCINPVWLKIFTETAADENCFIILKSVNYYFGKNINKQSGGYCLYAICPNINSVNSFGNITGVHELNIKMKVHTKERSLIRGSSGIVNPILGFAIDYEKEFNAKLSSHIHRIKTKTKIKNSNKTAHLFGKSLTIVCPNSNIVILKDMKMKYLSLIFSIVLLNNYLIIGNEDWSHPYLSLFSEQLLEIKENKFDGKNKDFLKLEKALIASKGESFKRLSKKKFLKNVDVSLDIVKIRKATYPGREFHNDSSNNNASAKLMLQVPNKFLKKAQSYFRERNHPDLNQTDSNRLDIFDPNSKK